MFRKQPHYSDPAIKYVQLLGDLMRLSVSWTNAAANALGVHPTELMAGSYLYDVGAMTAGELAKVTGLTTGAMTAAIDRLEHAGFAKRQVDPHDRRKVIVKPTKIPAKLLAMREEMMKRVRPVFSRYSDAEFSRMIESTRELMTVFEKEMPNLKKALPKNKNRRAI